MTKSYIENELARDIIEDFKNGKRASTLHYSTKSGNSTLGIDFDQVLSIVNETYYNARILGNPNGSFICYVSLD